jgi:acetyl esterase/lipase
VIIALLAVACGGEREQSYLERRAAFTTQLTGTGIPENYMPDWVALPEWDTPRGTWQEVVYPSRDLALRAFMHMPPDIDVGPFPAVVILHGSFNVHFGAFEHCRPFAEAGFVCMVPAFRGENGNPGRTEMMLGEVDDAAAAVRWLVEKPHIDGRHVYVLGYSYGGAIATLLSLQPDVPIRHSASIAGLAHAEFFDEVTHIFNLDDPEEREMRLLLGNIRWMQHRHYAYVGSADPLTVTSVDAAMREMAESPSLLEIITVPGDHISVEEPALAMHVSRILSEMNQEE